MLNALLGLGTALAPVFVAIFVGLGFWWGLPLTVGRADRRPARRQPAPAAARRAGGTARRGAAGRPIPARFWLFAAFAVLYGICETMNGNWSQLDMTSELGASTTVASLALTTFWAMVTVGRVAVRRDPAVVPDPRDLPPAAVRAGRRVRRSSPRCRTARRRRCAAFGLAGLGCSALLPLTISFAQEELVTIAAATSGLVIAAYQVGYGMAAFGAGPLQSAGMALRSIFLIVAGAAAIMAVLSFRIARPEHAVTTVHPRPR